jgi:hypothetical protein
MGLGSGRLNESLPGRIFISYRHQETAWPAGRLYDVLVEHFPAEQVFKDVDNIEPGEDFVERITAAVGSCDVLLALIGPHWLTIIDENGQRRLDNPGDYVRLEVETALTRKIRVIPILVDEARMPRVNELPPTLAPLIRRSAVEINPLTFDTKRLISTVDKTLAEPNVSDTTTGSASPTSTPRPDRTNQQVAGPQVEQPTVQHKSRKYRVRRNILLTLAGLLVVGSIIGIVGSDYLQAPIREDPGAAPASRSTAGPIERPENYGKLISHLPASERSTCQNQHRWDFTESGELLAEAVCYTGIYQLWNNGHSARSSVLSTGMKEGDCLHISPDKAGAYRNWSEHGMSGLLTCNSRDNEYSVKWSIDQLGITGTFRTAFGPKSGVDDYQEWASVALRVRDEVE